MSDNKIKHDDNTIKLDLSFNRSKDDLKLIGLVIVCLVINLVCNKVVNLLGLSLYCDCIGTIAAAIIGGFMPAVLVGFFTNILSSLSDSSNLYYSVCNVLIAIVAATFSQNKYLRKLSWKIIIPTVCFILVGGGVGSLITWGLYGNTMGKELASSLAGRIYTNVVQDAFWAQMYAGLIMDIPDKVISVILAFIIYKTYPKKFKPERDRVNLASIAQKGISLSGKIIISVILIFSIAATVVTFVSYNQFRDTLVASEAQYATDTAKFAATLIDGDKVDEYLRRKDSAEGYFRIKRYYSLIWNSSDRIQYLYVYQIQEDGCHVVFDVDTPDTPGSETGTVIPFDESFAPYIDDLLAGKEIDPIITDDTYGWLLSSYVPVYDSNNRCKCYVCVDVAMPNITETERTFTFKITTILLGFLVTVLTLSIYLAKRFIVSPVNSLAKLASDFAYTDDEARKETLDSIRNFEIRTGDEIEHLYNAMAKTTRDTVDYINQSQRKNEAISTFQSGMINVMADLVESRDQSTGEHIKNTSSYVEIICDELIKEGKFADILDEEFKNNIVSSAPMHDIGKIKVSDTILNKPGKFEPWEYEIMKTHAEEGAKIIRTVKKTVDNKELKENYLGEAENMAHYHHEKWNGQGYPCGLKGEEIPLSARIMAVADVFDALVAKRVYKPAMPFEKAFSIIKESSGEHFDPVIVEAFLNAEDKIRAVTEQIH
ncbi:MAG: HD domain-containing protein [Clostridiales bacterium]|nr:HD domain-containing protein [Clostridiales bacterium]